MGGQILKHFWFTRSIKEVMLEKIDWLYRLGQINYFKIGGTPSVVFLICIGIGAYLYIGMEQKDEKQKKRKETEELIKSAQVRVHAYRLGLEQREMQEKHKNLRTRKRLS